MKIKKNGKVINLTESDLQRIVKRVLKENEENNKPTDVKVQHGETTHWKLSDTDGFNSLKIGNNITDNENHYKNTESNKVYGKIEDNSIEFEFDSRVSDGSKVTDVKLEFTEIQKHNKSNWYEVMLNVTYKNSGVRTLSSSRTNIKITNLPKGRYVLQNNINNTNWLIFTVN